MKMFYNKEVELLVFELESGEQYIFNVPVDCADYEMEDLSDQAVIHPDQFFSDYTPSIDWEIVDTSDPDYEDLTHIYITLRK